MPVVEIEEAKDEDENEDDDDEEEDNVEDKDNGVFLTVSLSCLL